MTCRRCGHELVMDLVGVPKCLSCHQREHDQIDRLIAGLRAEADRAHQQLTRAAESQPGSAVSA